MSVFRSTSFRMGLAMLLILVLLRLMGVDPGRAAAVFWALGFAWPFLVGLAFLLDKGVNLSHGSPWGVLLVATSLVVCPLTLAAIGLPMGQIKFDPFLVGFLGVVLVVLCVGWWRLFRPTKPYASEQVARPWLFIAFGVIAAIGVLLDKLGFIRG